MNQSIDQLVRRSFNQSVSRQIGQSVNQSMNQAINLFGVIGQSINRPVNHFCLQLIPQSSPNTSQDPKGTRTEEQSRSKLANTLLVHEVNTWK